MNLKDHKQDITDNGYTIIDDVFSSEEVSAIISCIGNTDTTNAAFRKTNDLFAIRRFLQEVPDAVSYIFTDRFSALTNDLFGAGLFVVKSI